MDPASSSPPRGQLHLTDLDGDGDRDLLRIGVAGYHAHLLGEDGAYAVEPTPARMGRPTHAWDCADLDADGASELVLLDGRTVRTVSFVDGDFTGPATLLEETTWCPRGLQRLRCARDVDGDGRVDLVVPRTGAHRIHLRKAEGWAEPVEVAFRPSVRQTFGAPRARWTPHAGRADPLVHRARRDGDGRRDVVSETEDSVAPTWPERRDSQPNNAEPRPRRLPGGARPLLRSTSTTSSRPSPSAWSGASWTSTARARATWSSASAAASAPGWAERARATKVAPRRSSRPRATWSGSSCDRCRGRRCRSSSSFAPSGSVSPGCSATWCSPGASTSTCSPIRTRRGSSATARPGGTASAWRSRACCPWSGTTAWARRSRRSSRCLRGASGAREGGDDVADLRGDRLLLFVEAAPAPTTPRPCSTGSFEADVFSKASSSPTWTPRGWRRARPRHRRARHLRLRAACVRRPPWGRSPA